MTSSWTFFSSTPDESEGDITSKPSKQSALCVYSLKSIRRWHHPWFWSKSWQKVKKNKRHFKIFQDLMVSWCSGSSWATSSAASLEKVQEASTSYRPGDIFPNLKLFLADIFLMQICFKYLLTLNKIFSSNSFSSPSFTLGPLSSKFFHGSLSFRFSPFREQEKGFEPGA